MADLLPAAEIVYDSNTMRFLSIYDPTNREAPTISPKHPQLSDDQAQSVVHYLRSGTVVLRTTATRPDLLDDGAVVLPSASSFTDGFWIWNESLPFYVDKYKLSPGDEFLDYCEGRSWVPRKPTDEEVAEALQMITG